MNWGLCLTGGGAKGAFAAGVIKYLNECDYNFRIITGTSIGAINAYFMLKNNYKKLYEMWLNVSELNLKINSSKVIDNTKLIEGIKNLHGDNERIEHLFVNYVEVLESRLYERVVDIRNLKEAEALEVIKASSLLPYNLECENGNQVKFDSKTLFDRFKKDVEDGVYDGYRLDGGILNNCLLSPFIDNEVDKILIIALKDTFEIPNYIFKYYEEDDVILIKPDFQIKSDDTIRFNRDFCIDLFYKGYNLVKENIEILGNL